MVLQSHTTKELIALRIIRIHNKFAGEVTSQKAATKQNIFWKRRHSPWKRVMKTLLDFEKIGLLCLWVHLA